MSFRTTYILFGVLLAELLVFGLFQAFSVRPGDDLYAMPTLRKARNLNKDFDKDFKTVEIERTRPTAEKIVFTRGDDGHWKMTQPTEAHVEGDDTVSGIIQQVVETHRDDRVPDPGRNLKERGLDNPATTVTLTNKEGKSWKLNLGNESFGDANRAYVFVNSSDLPGEILPVRRGDLDNLFKSAKDFRLKDLVTPSSFNLQNVELTDASKNALKLKKENESRWSFVEPKYGDAEYESEGGMAGQGLKSVKELLNTLESIKVAYNPTDKDKTDDFVADNVKDLAKYGLDKPALRIGFERKVGSLLGGDDKEAAVKDAVLIGKEVEDKDAKEPKVYAKLESENNVVKVLKKNVKPVADLVTNPNALRNKDLVKLKEDAKSKIDAIDIKNASGLMKLRKVDGQWRIWDSPTKSVVADRATVEGLINALTLPRQVKDFPTNPNKKELGLEPDSGYISVWVEGVQKPEPKKDDKKEEAKKEEAKKDEPKKDDKKEEPKKEEAKKDDKKEEPKAENEPTLKDKDKPTFKLVFGRKMPDGTVNVIREEGNEKLTVTLADALLSRLNESRLAYLDKTLPTFAFNADIPKITIQKGNATTVVEKTKNADGKEVWMLKGQMPLPDRLADTTKVEAIIKELRELTADSIVSETKPAANVLTAKYGLLPPEVKVTVTIKKSEKESEDFVYSFGKVTENKEKRYARIDIVPPPANLDRDWIFTVRPEVTDKLTVDLSDPSVTDFSPSKVKGITLVGWQKLAGDVRTLHLVQNGMGAEGWKLGPNNKVEIELDGTQVEAMLNQLKHLRADKFLDHNLKEPPAGLELKDKEANLIITLQFADAKEKEAPLVLRIGKYLEKDNGYAAMVSTRPGDVFVLPKKELPRKNIDGKEKDLVEAGVGYFKP
jgi:hypothetical protein